MTRRKRVNGAVTRQAHDERTSMPIDVGMLPNLLGYNLRRAQIALWRNIDRTSSLRPARPGLFSLLVLVDANPGISQAELASVLSKDKAAINGLVELVRKRRWLLRRQSEVDRRRHGLFLTSAGQAALKETRDDVLAREQRFKSRFTAEEVAQLIALLRRIEP